jgi:hypothetical protein
LERFDHQIDESELVHAVMDRPPSAPESGSSIRS